MLLCADHPGGGLVGGAGVAAGGYRPDVWYRLRRWWREIILPVFPQFVPVNSSSRRSCVELALLDWLVVLLCVGHQGVGRRVDAGVVPGELVEGLVQVPVPLEAVLGAEEASLDVELDTCRTLELGRLAAAWGLARPAFHLKQGGLGVSLEQGGVGEVVLTNKILLSTRL